jgi:GTPase
VNDKASHLTLIVGIDTQNNSNWTITDSLNELSELSRTAGLTVVHRISQVKRSPHPKFYVGKGKLDEISTYCENEEIHILIVDDELTPNQQRTIEDHLKTVKVLDRTSLILDIFAKRAQTYEAQLQVELAQLGYLLPRLTRLWTHLSRLGGGIGTKGPGEKQLEVDKRQVRKKISFIKKKLEKIQLQRNIRRNNRQQAPTLTGVLVGYTNAGKSTLMNQLTKAAVLVENKLFATLDTTTRQFNLPNNEEVVISDTVGFIQKLPHHLVKAFYSTLEEVTYADFILHVVDASHPNVLGMIKTSLDTIKDLGADETPTLFVFNKIDSVQKINECKNLLKDYAPAVYISALNQVNFTELLEKTMALINEHQEEIPFHIPYKRMDIVNLLHQHGKVLEERYEETIFINVLINKTKANRIMNMLNK